MTARSLPKRTTYEMMVAGLLGDMFWSSILYEQDEFGNKLFKGCHDKLDASQSDDDWYIWKYSANGQQGPLVGSWTDRDNLSWDSVGYTSFYQGETQNLEQLELLKRILDELKKITLQLSLITDEKVTEEDIRNAD